jgi:anti-sigma B factor antagonist
VQLFSPDRPISSCSVERAVRGTTQIVSVRGEVDIAAAHALSAAIDRAIGLHPDRVVVDLSATTFMDGSGVHCLLRADRHAKARTVDLVVISGSTAVQRVLALSGADQHLRLATSSRPENSRSDQIRRDVAAARRAARYMTGEAEDCRSLSETILNSDRQMRQRLHPNPAHNAKPVR